MRFGLQHLNDPSWLFDPNDLGAPYDQKGILGLTAAWVVPVQANHSPVFPDTTIGQTVLYAPDGGTGSASRPGGSGTGGSGGGTPVSTGPTSLVINITWDSSVQSAPSSFTAAVTAAVQYLESQFTDPVTVNISVGYGEVNGASLGSYALGASQSYLTSVSYSNLRSAVASDATSADDSAAAASLPSSSPVSGNFWTTTAQAKALGLASATGASTDGFVGFSSTLPFTYDNSAGVASGTYDFNGVALHEFSEVMGRMLFTGATIGTTSSSYDLLDLLHYSAPGVRDFSASTAGYFSPDSGTSNLGTFNTTSGGDAGDWSSQMGNDSFDAFSNSGVVNAVTTNDLRELDTLGWNRPGISTPTGVNLAPVTAGIAAAQGSTGLAANVALAVVTQVGGSSADTYSYSLGGTDAASFTLAPAGNAATLATGATGLAGAAGGRLYAVTITASDTTDATSAPASPVAVIVGSAGADTIGVATLTSALGAPTPAFIYGLAGADTINATGMTGKLCLTGGAGADTMTGGSGVNRYIYGAASDSTATTMDVISNFHATTDLIDLTGLGRSLTYAGNIHGSKLAAGSIGWQASGGNTFVYVNTSASSEQITSTDMKIEMLGSVSLGSGNFGHV